MSLFKTYEKGLDTRRTKNFLRGVRCSTLSKKFCCATKLLGLLQSLYFFACEALALKRSTRPAVSITFSCPV
jgi:hypothetical protein